VRLCLGIGSACTAVVILPALFPLIAIAASGGWEYQPYRVRVIIAFDLPGGLDEKLRQVLPTYIQQRADAALTPLWLFDVRVATGVEVPLIRRSLSTENNAKPAAELTADHEKLLLLDVHRTSTGYELSAREYDTYLERWSPPIVRSCPQLSNLPEQLFALAERTSAPVAQFEVDQNQAISLNPRGSALPQNTNGPIWAKPGDVFLPMLRRTSRNGQPLENGITPVPWTYIEATTTPDDKQGRLKFTIQSGSRHPFPARKQARTEQLALAVRADAAPTVLHLQSRKSDTKPLAGFDVFALDTPTKAPVHLGTSDIAGNITLPAGNSPIEMLLIKHGGQLLAKLPVAPGAEQLIKVPLPDDDARLAAEERLGAVRENLIDIVARRNILTARVRQKIEKKDFKAAEDLLRSLDELPNKSQFNLSLTTSARLIRSDDPRIQRRIDQMFEAAQNLSTQFLDLKPISQLHDELREAQQKTESKTNKT
jgi:hypothetical protein